MKQEKKAREEIDLALNIDGEKIPMKMKLMNCGTGIARQRGRTKSTIDITDRVTADMIASLAPEEVFVFGSNLAGSHGGGAAWTAYNKFGAIWGQGVGMQGQSYAIPTMQGGVDTIAPYVDEFIEYARTHPEKKFLVTAIGCGIAGFHRRRLPHCSATQSISKISHYLGDSGKF